MIATNTTLARDGLAPADQPRAAEAGGLSGRPLTERARKVVHFVHQETGGALPIIGVGGIVDPDDATRLFDAGASLVQLYTGFIYRGPALVRSVARSYTRPRGPGPAMTAGPAARRPDPGCSPRGDLGLPAGGTAFLTRVARSRLSSVLAGHPARFRRRPSPAQARLGSDRRFRRGAGLDPGSGPGGSGRNPTSARDRSDPRPRPDLPAGRRAARPVAGGRGPRRGAAAGA